MRFVRRLCGLAAAGAAIWSAATASAETANGRYLLSEAQIMAAMQARHLPIHGVTLSLPAAITSATADASLDITDVTAIDSRDLRLRVSCRDRSGCLPFFAIARYSEAIDPALLRSKADRPPSPDQATQASDRMTTVPATADQNKSSSKKAPAIVRNGSPATLDFDEERIHVRVDVICLESGSAGDRIRVAARDHKQVYTAEIVTPHTLKGILAR